MQRPLDDLDEVALLAQDQPFGLGHLEILARLGIVLQPRPIALVRREAVEGDQPPRHVVRALVRQEVADAGARRSAG